jgi:HK97 family phage major capsid protein
MKNLKKLQDRAAAIAARLKELSDVEDRSEEQVSEIESLTSQVEEVRKAIRFEETLAAKEAELRSIVEPAAPVAEPVVPATPEPEVRAEEEPKKVEIRHALPHHTELRALNKSERDVELAYRMGKWMGAQFYKRDEDARWCKDHGIEVRTLSNAGDNDNLVPPEFANRIIRLVDEYGVLPKVAENVSMAREVYNLPKRTGGVTANFVAESAAIGQSDPTYAQVQLTAQKLTVATRMSAEFVADAVVNMVDAVAQEFATAIAKKIDACGFIGDGSAGYGSMTGAVNALGAAGVLAAASGNTSVETLDMDDFLKAVGSVKSYARGGAAWFCSAPVWAASIQRLKYAGGGNTTADIARGAVDSFLGFPVYIVEDMDSTLGADPSAVKVLFGDMRKACILGRRQDFSARLYDQVFATTDELLLQGKTRFDIVVHDAGDGSETGSVVGLATAAS